MDKWKLIIDHFLNLELAALDEKGGCTFIGGIKMYQQKNYLVVRKL